MSIDQKIAKNLGLRVFFGLWIILFGLALVVIVMPALNAMVRLNGLSVVAAIIVPIVVPALYLGRALGSKMQASGFVRTIWYQILGGIVWTALSAIWMFIVVFHEKIFASFLGKASALDLGRVFLDGFPFVATMLSIVLIPSTILASAVLASILRNQGQPHVQ